MISPKPEPAGERRLTWLVLSVAIVASTWLVRRAKPHAEPEPTRLDLVSAVPNGPELLVTVDVENLGAAAAQELLRAGGGALLGLREQCGFEPILGLRRVAFATPQPIKGQATGDFALIAETSLDQAAVLRCAEAVIRKRGGQPVRSTLGAFTSVRDQGKPLGEVAMRADGLFIMSGGQYFRDVVDAAGGAVNGDAAARVRTRVHLGIRKQLAPSQLVLTLIPGETSTLTGVQALGLGLEIKLELELRGFVGCRSEAACGEARELALHLKDELARDPSVSGLSSLSVVQQQQQLVIGGHLPRAQLAALLSQLIAF
jgi:hypothetical protein